MSLNHYGHHHRQLLKSPQEPGNQFMGSSKIVTITFITLFFTAMAYILIDLAHHCLFRLHRHRQPQETIVVRLHPNSTLSQRNPMTQSQLDAIPVVIYSRSLNDTEETCSVCLGEYIEGEEMSVLPKCKHIFHKECIDRWLTTRSSLCPICRDCLFERSEVSLP
ncbi:uncharacterized protein A4U43_C04F8680 [Asparagus officinalis]|uniref:RING-type domain-containing protein n=1 Tax=Asparagus officinalis TaxID=4686 RepID=A0A5P1F3U0_ASPOF|nr:uncharacterized protein A4U43_C04F8680 [Asparagus officinalis]